jgi:hypothetical protein
MLFTIQAFGGESPRTAPRLLPANMAVLAQNAKLWSGELRPFFNPRTVALPSRTGDLKTIFWYNDTYWLSWNNVVDVVRSPLASDTTGRIYYTGDGAPKMTDSSLVAVTGHGTNYPTDAYLLGVPRPTGTITAALNATPGAGSGLDRDVVYTYTFVSSWGEEGPPNATPSAKLTCKSGQLVDLGGFMTSAGASYPNITKARIYRSMSGATTTTWRFVKEITLGTATQSDNVEDSLLGEVLTSTNYLPPPADLAGLASHPGGFLVGFSGNNLYMSEPYRPHAWPYGYVYSVPATIVGIGIAGDSIVCLTRDYPYIFSGSSPTAMRRTKYPERQPCLSRRGIASFEGGVIYPSPDGLYLISGEQSGQLLTRDILTKGDWYKYKPSEMHAVIMDQKYYGFYKTSVVDGSATGRAIALDLVEPQARFTEFSLYCHGAHVVPDTDTLYLSRKVDGANVIQQFEGDSTRLYYTWRSKVFPTFPTNLGAAQVLADLTPILSSEEVEELEQARNERIVSNAAMIVSNADFGSIAEDAFGELEVAGSRLLDVGDVVSDETTLAFILRVDGVVRHQQSVVDSEPFTLPAGYVGREFQVDVVGNASVKQINIASSVPELAGASGG